MDKEYLMNQIDYVQARAEELDKLILDASANNKGYKEAIDSYNKWVDRYSVLTDALLHFDDVNIEQAKLDFEKEKLKVEQQIETEKIKAEKEKQALMKEIEDTKLNFEKEKLINLQEIENSKLDSEKDKQALMQEIEQDKINVETEKIRLEREKFANDVKVQLRSEIEQDIFETAELAVKIGVPVAVILAVVGVAKLSYTKEAELELCNGRVFGGIKDLLSLARLAI